MQAKSRSLASQEAPASSGLELSLKNTDSDIKRKAPGLYRVIRRNGELTGFDQSKISVAIRKAFLAVEESSAIASIKFQKTITAATNNVVDRLKRRKTDGGTFHIEEIQDQVELCLVRAGHYKIARAYMLYREARAKERSNGALKPIDESPSSPGPIVRQADSGEAPRHTERLHNIVAATACADIESINLKTLRQVGSK